MFGSHHTQETFTLKKVSERNKPKNLPAPAFNDPGTKVIIPISHTDYCKDEELFNALQAFVQNGVDPLKQLYFVDTSYLHRYPSSRDDLNLSESELFVRAQKWHRLWLTTLFRHFKTLGLSPDFNWEGDHILDWKTITNQSPSFKARREELKKDYQSGIEAVKKCYDKTVIKRLEKPYADEAENYAAGILKKKYLGSENNKETEKVQLLTINGKEPSLKVEIKKVSNAKGNEINRKARGDLVEEFNNLKSDYILESRLGHQMLDYNIEEDAFMVCDEIASNHHYFYYPRGLSQCMLHAIQTMVWNQNINGLRFISGVELLKQSQNHMRPNHADRDLLPKPNQVYTHLNASSSPHTSGDDSIEEDLEHETFVTNTLHLALTSLGSLFNNPVMENILKNHYNTNGHTGHILNIIEESIWAAAKFLGIPEEELKSSDPTSSEQSMPQQLVVNYLTMALRQLKLLMGSQDRNRLPFSEILKKRYKTNGNTDDLVILLNTIVNTVVPLLEKSNSQAILNDQANLNPPPQFKRDPLKTGAFEETGRTNSFSGAPVNFNTRRSSTPVSPAKLQNPNKQPDPSSTTPSRDQYRTDSTSSFNNTK